MQANSQHSGQLQNLHGQGTTPGNGTGQNFYQLCLPLHTASPSYSGQTATGNYLNLHSSISKPVTRFWLVAFKLQKTQSLHKKISLIQTIRCRQENRTPKLFCGTCHLIARYSYLLTTQIYKVLPTIMGQTCHIVPLTLAVYTCNSKLPPQQLAQIICSSLINNRHSKF